MLVVDKQSLVENDYKDEVDGNIKKKIRRMRLKRCEKVIS